MPSSSHSRSSARLHVGDGPSRRIIPLESLPFTIGRSADRHLHLTQPQVSREHAFIDRDSDGFFIRDLGSRHGTFVNGLPLRSATARLRTQDEIILGASGQGSSAERIVFEATGSDMITRTLMAHLAQAGSGPADLETLSLLLEAAQSLNGDDGLNDVLHTALEYTIRLTHAERGFVFLGDSAGALTLGQGQDYQGADLTDYTGISQGIVRDAVASQQEFILGNATQEAARNNLDSLVLHSIRSVCAIPLRGRHSERLLGLLYLDSRSSTHQFTTTDRGTLIVIARQAATLLENLRMLEAVREAALLRKELEIAAAIQLQIIPQTLPEFPFARLAARTIPCTGVGGDFYDVIPVPDGFVAIVADVSGKGVPAALLSCMVQGMVHAQITSGASLVATANCVNQLVCSRAGEKYVTLAAVRYTHSSDGPAQVELLNGGHVSPIIVRASGAIEVITDGDMPVGLLSFATFHPIHLGVSPGDRIVLLSDGISEAEDPSGVQFSATELTRTLTHPDPVANLFTSLECFCAGAHAQDDQTILTIESLA